MNKPRPALAQRLPKARQGPLDYGRRLWLKLLFLAIFILLYAPIATLVAFSFNTDRRNVVWRTVVQRNTRDGGRVERRTFVSSQLAWWF